MGSRIPFKFDQDVNKSQQITLMAPIRLRHAKGVSTIEVLSDSTVQDLQQEIYAQTQILPSRQIRLFFIDLFIQIPFYQLHF